MNCEQMTVLLSAWLDGELSREEEVQMQAHLEQCAECRALFEQLQALHTSFSELEELSAPEGFAQGVMDLVRAEEAPKVVPLFKRPAVRSAVGLAACALLCVGVVRMAFNGGFGSSTMDAAPECAAPEAAAYDMETYDLPAQAEEYSLIAASGAESGMEMGADYGEDVSEPGAPMPEAAEAPAAQAPESTAKQDEEPERGVVEIVLTVLPEGLEETLGALAWEERLSDGAQCAPLTGEQAEALLALVLEEGLAAEVSAPETGAEDGWILVWKPN